MLVILAYKDFKIAKHREHKEHNTSFVHVLHIIRHNLWSTKLYHSINSVRAFFSDGLSIAIIPLFFSCFEGCSLLKTDKLFGSNRNAA